MKPQDISSTQLSLGSWTDSNNFLTQSLNKDKRRWFTEEINVATFNALGFEQMELQFTILKEMNINFTAIKERKKSKDVNM